MHQKRELEIKGNLLEHRGHRDTEDAEKNGKAKCREFFCFFYFLCVLCV